MQRLLAYLRPHTFKMTLAFVSMVITTGLMLLIPYLVKVAIDTHIAGRNFTGLSWTAAAIGVAYVGIYITTMSQRYFLSWVGQKVLATLRSQLFEHLQRMPLGYHDTHIIGVTVSRVINDVAIINELLSQGVITVLGDSLLLVGIIGAMILMSPRLALLTFVVLPLMIVATAVFSALCPVGLSPDAHPDRGGGRQSGGGHRGHRA